MPLLLAEPTHRCPTCDGNKFELNTCLYAIHPQGKDGDLECDWSCINCGHHVRGKLTIARDVQVQIVGGGDPNRN